MEALHHVVGKALACEVHGGRRRVALPARGRPAVAHPSGIDAPVGDARCVCGVGGDEATGIAGGTVMEATVVRAHTTAEGLVGGGGEGRCRRLP